MGDKKEFDWADYFRVYDTLNYIYPYKDILLKCSQIVDLKNKNVLDVGCGTGNVTKVLLKGGANVTAIDNNKTAVEVTKQKNKEASVQVIDVVQDLPFEDSLFDVVTMVNVLYAVKNEDRGKVAKELLRVLKPGGKIVCVNPTRNFSSTKFLFLTFAYHVNKNIFETLKLIFTKLPSFILLLSYNLQLSKNLQQQFIEKDEYQSMFPGCSIAIEPVYFGMSWFVTITK